MENKLTYYNIYGFVLAVDSGIKKTFETEYWRFKVSTQKKVDLYVLKTDKKDLPVKLRLDTRGIYIPFGKNENIVFYEPGVRSDWVLYSIEPLIHWKDKCFLHCGAVSKNGQAIVFPAEGGVGKTTMATFLVSKGYEYLSDDWLIIGKDGNAYPFFKTIHVFDYNLKNKLLAKKVLGKKRGFYTLLFKFLDLVPKILPNRFIRIMAERAKPIFSVDFTILHPNAELGKVCPIRKIYWLKKDPTITNPILKKIDSTKISEKMPYITALETNHFYKNYFEWVYNNLPNLEIEKRIETEKEILKQAFKGTESYELRVPVKIDPTKVFDLIK